MDGKEDRRRRPPQQDKTTDIIMLEIQIEVAVGHVLKFTTHD